jgi:hypothetical protein
VGSLSRKRYTQYVEHNATTNDPETGADHTASAAARQRSGSAGRQRQWRCNGIATDHSNMAEEEWKIVRRVPNTAQDDMVLPRAGTIASWIRNTMTEMNKAYGAAIAAFIEAGGTYPRNEPGCDGDIMAAQDPFVKIAYRKLKKQYQWMLREGNFLDETPKGAYTRSLNNKQKGPLSRRQQKRKASTIGCSGPPPWRRQVGPIVPAQPHTVLQQQAPNRTNNGDVIPPPAAIFNAAPNGTFPAHSIHVRFHFHARVGIYSRAFSAAHRPAS